MEIIKEFWSGESVVVLIINDVVDIFSKVMFLFWIYKGIYDFCIWFVGVEWFFIDLSVVRINSWEFFFFMGFYG